MYIAPAIGHLHHAQAVTFVVQAQCLGINSDGALKARLSGQVIEMQKICDKATYVQKVIYV